MKKRLFTDWTIQRVALLLIGTLILVAALAAAQWLGAALGGFLAAMGLFGYRRGAGNCYGGSCKPYGATSDAGCCAQQMETVSSTEEPETSPVA